MDFLSKTIKKNSGEITQYYIQNSHPAIIDPDTFELVQNEIKRRRPGRRHLHKNSPFTAKIICGECGAYYGRKVWHSGTKYRSYIWRCNRKYNGDVPCSTPNLREDEIEDAFIVAFNQLLGDRARYIAHFEELLPLLVDTSDLEKKLDALTAQQTELWAKLRLCIAENARQVQDQDAYNDQYNEVRSACDAVEAEIAQTQKEILAQLGRKEQIHRCLNELRRRGDILEEFELELWNAVAESVTVSKNKTLSFRFRDGTEVPVLVPETE